MALQLGRPSAHLGARPVRRRRPPTGLWGAELRGHGRGAASLLGLLQRTGRTAPWECHPPRNRLSFRTGPPDGKKFARSVIPHRSLARAVEDGLALLTRETESFALADHCDEAAGRYLGLQAGRRPAPPESPTLLVMQATSPRRSSPVCPV